MLELAALTPIDPAAANPVLVAAGSAPITAPHRIGELGRRPGVSTHQLLVAAGVEVHEAGVQWADIELKYSGYLARERIRASRLSQMEELRLPENLEYGLLRTLSFEAREKLSRVKPATLGQASRIPGVSPSDVQSLVVELLKLRPRFRRRAFHVKQPISFPSRRAPPFK